MCVVNNFIYEDNCFGICLIKLTINYYFYENFLFSRTIPLFITQLKTKL